MPTPRYLFTTYASAQDALTSIDTWLVNTMGYTRNLAPTADSVTYTGYKAHYQFTFGSGETLYLNFHTDTTKSMLYLTTSRSYAAGTAWNAQTGTATVLSGSVIYGSAVIPTSSSNNSMYLFGDDKGNCQVFFQRGTTISISDYMHWGLLDKSGFGTWAGGCYFGALSLTSVTLSQTNVGPYIDLCTYSTHAPSSAIDITMDSITTWAALKSFATNSSYSSEVSSTIGSSSSSWSAIIVGADVGSSYEQYNHFYTAEDGGSYCASHSLTNTVETIIGGTVNSITGKIYMSKPATIYARHEATQRLSPIGRIPFGYHCPIAGYFQFVAPGTQLVQDGRTFIMIGNIAAEMVSV